MIYDSSPAGGVASIAKKHSFLRYELVEVKKFYIIYAKASDYDYFGDMQSKRWCWENNGLT